MAESNIEWTEMTWNPTTGCDKISQGCKNCYAERMAKRLYSMGIEKYSNKFKITEHQDSLKDPYKWKKRRIVFVNSMSDLFHEKVTDEFIQNVFNVMKDTEHIYQILTKRSERLLDFDKNILKGKWPHNIWMGVSVEDGKVIDRIDHLRTTGARVKFLSCEPLIGPLNNLNLDKIDWVIVGGESGPKSRKMKEEWVIDIMEQCQKKDISFFFKQWGGVNKKKSGRELNGKTYDDMPEMNGVLADAGYL
jgi:protein gp37